MALEMENEIQMRSRNSLKESPEEQVTKLSSLQKLFSGRLHISLSDESLPVIESVIGAL